MAFRLGFCRGIPSSQKQKNIKVTPFFKKKNYWWGLSAPVVSHDLVKFDFNKHIVIFLEGKLNAKFREEER